MHAIREEECVMVNLHGREALQQVFAAEAGEQLDRIGQKLDALASRPGSGILRIALCRDLHPVTNSAGFLGVAALRELCDLTAALFARLRDPQVPLSAGLLVLIRASLTAMRSMLSEIEQAQQPAAADAELLARLRAAAADARVHGRQQ